MKKFKYVVIILLVLACVSSLISCGGKKLSKPDNLEINGKTLSWRAVKNAKGYYVDIDGDIHTVDACNFDLSELNTLNTCQIKVKAKGDDTDYTDSDWSDVKNYAAYKTPDKLWLNLSYPDGEIRNYVKFNGEHGGLYYDVYYYDSVINRVPTKKCIVRITEDVYYKYEWEPDNNDNFRWVKKGGNLTKNTAGKEAYNLFNVLFAGNREGEFVSENVRVDGTDVLCKKYSQTGNKGTSYYWRPDGFDFWIQCNSFDSTGNPFEIIVENIDLNLSFFPEFVLLP